MKVLLTIPFRAIPGVVALLFCGLILLIGVSVKTICAPKEPLFDLHYNNDHEEAALVSWKKGFCFVWNWIVSGE